MKLSIITVNLNNAAGLQKTIESVVKQTFIDYEFIIIDGESTDGSVDIIKQYADKITYWGSQPAKGIYNAMNKGIIQAKGEYCHFLNSADCIIQSDGLEYVFSKNPVEDLVYFDVQYTDKTVRLHNERLTLEYFFRRTINHQSVFFKRSLFSTYGLYSEEYRIFSDLDYYLRTIIKEQCSYQYIPYLLVNYNLDGMSRRGSIWEYRCMEREKVLKDNFPMMYDDYQELIALKSEMLSIKSSRLIRLIRKIQLSGFYQWIRKVKNQ